VNEAEMPTWKLAFVFLVRPWLLRHGFSLKRVASQWLCRAEASLAQLLHILGSKRLVDKRANARGTGVAGASPAPEQEVVCSAHYRR
jgi:hypothetical protein